MQFGQKCENWAAEYAAMAKGWQIHARNVYSRHGELDLVCHDGEMWRFIEVKGRRGAAFGRGPELVSPAKLRRLKKCISLWMQREGWGPWQLDLWCLDDRGRVQEFSLLP